MDITARPMGTLGGDGRASVPHDLDRITERGTGLLGLALPDVDRGEISQQERPSALWRPSTVTG
jgi:hypothetical protein